MTVCTILDDFIQSYLEGNPHWRVVLNNNQTIYCDDGRPGMEPRSAWIRLGDYCKNNNLYITNMTIGFRDNTYSLPSNMDGYYFCLGSRGGIGMQKTMKLFFVGALQNGVLKVTCWKVPEMIEEITEERDPQKAGICLIQKNISPYMEL